MSVYHILLLRANEGADPKAMQSVCKQFIGLQEKCLHPMTYQPYIQSIVGGQNISDDPSPQVDVTHSFIVEFDSVIDRDYYRKKDPMHFEFVKACREVSVKVQDVDFEDGRF